MVLGVGGQAVEPSWMGELGCPLTPPTPRYPSLRSGGGPGAGGGSTAAGLLWVLSVCSCLAWVLWGALGEKRGNTVFFFYLDSACLPRADKTLRVSLCLDPGQWDVRGSSPGAAAVDVSSPGTSVIKLNQ